MKLKENHLDVKVINQAAKSLKTIQIEKLSQVCKQLKNSNHRLVSEGLPNSGGVYVFWWTGDKALFRDSITRKHIVSGPSKRPVKIDITDTWLNVFDDKICLYVGKNSSSIKKRLSRHLRLSTVNEYSKLSATEKIEMISKAGPFRKGISKLFLKEKDIRKLIMDNVGFSYFELGGDENSVNRFYLEDRMIGELYPILNVDIER